MRFLTRRFIWEYDPTLGKTTGFFLIMHLQPSVQCNGLTSMFIKLLKVSPGYGLANIVGMPTAAGQREGRTSHVCSQLCTDTMRDLTILTTLSAQKAHTQIRGHNLAPKRAFFPLCAYVRVCEREGSFYFQEHHYNVGPFRLD